MSLIPQNLVADFKELFHGGMDDAQAFLYSQFAELRKDVRNVRDSLDALDTREEWFAKIGTGTVSAAGSVDVEIPGPRPGFLWILTGISVVVGNGAGSSAVLYAGRPSPSTPVLTIDDADFFVGAADVGQIPIFPNTNVVTVAVAGGPATERVTVTLRGKQVPSNE